MVAKAAVEGVAHKYIAQVSVVTWHSGVLRHQSVVIILLRVMLVIDLVVNEKLQFIIRQESLI